MERKIDNRTVLDKFAEEFCEVVENHSKYIICSGFVAIAHGRSRGTEDIDMIIEQLSQEKFTKLHKDLIDKGFVCIQSDDSETIFRYLEKGISVRYTYKNEGYFPSEMEIKFAKDELDKDQIKEKSKLPLTNLNIYFSSIEGNIAFKEELLKSDKNIEDARHLRIIYEENLDEDKIDFIKKKIRKEKLNER